MASKHSNERFFVRAGSYLRKRPLVAACLAVIFMLSSMVLLREQGVLFVAGFCLGMLSLTNFYIMLRGRV